MILLSLFGNLLVVFLPGSRDSLQDLFETGLTISILRRKIGSADKRLQVRRQPDAHRPAATAGGRLHKSHVNAIDIGAFLAIDFDVHKLAIHDRGHLFAFEGFMRHDVAPVAGRIADREKDRFVFAARLGERFLAPRIPVDRVMRVLQKVG